jgi:hypothetical protein
MCTVAERAFSHNRIMETLMANTLRGEVDIALGADIYTLRPSFQALSEIEHSIGKSVLILLNQFEEKGILLSEQVAILRAGLKAAGEKMPENIGELICEAGMVQVMDAVCRFLHFGVNAEEL